MRAAVGVVAKAPVPGRVKTRMCPPLTAEQAADVAAALLADTLAAATAAADPWLVLAAAADGGARPVGGPVSGGAPPCGVPVLAQRGDGLAARLAAAQADLFARGYDRVLLLAGDCPTVGPAALRRALHLLDAADVVLGPALDGGYTLVATARPLPVLFERVPMSTSATLHATLAAAAGAGLRATLLPPRHDLDTVADLTAALTAGQLTTAPATRAALHRLRADVAAPARG